MSEKLQLLQSQPNQLLNLENFQILQKFTRIFYISNDLRYYKIFNTEKQTYHVAKIKKKTLKNFSKDMLVDFYHEVNIYSKINHPSILRFTGYSPTNFKNKEKPVIVMEDFNPNYCLSTFLYSSSNKDFHNTKRLINLYGIASGMSYLHSHNIIHRNLNPHSIFLDKQLYPKITGFIISKEIQNSEHINFYNELKSTITSKELAPEVLNDLHYSKASDVYDFSMILFGIVVKDYPYIPDEIPEIIKQKVRPSFPKKIPKVFRKLIERCWSQEPEDRPTFDEIVKEFRTNPKFLTKSIDKDEYFNYIKYIDESQITFNDHPLIPNFEELIKEKFQPFNKNDVDIKLSSHLNSEIILDLNMYQKKDIIDFNKLKFNQLYDIYNIYEKETKTRFTARVYFKEVNTFSRHEIINFCREMSIIPKLNHPSILKFIGYSQVDFENNLHPSIINEFTTHKLEDILDSNDNLRWDDTKKIINIYGIAAGMSYLHSHNIIHRDLKPENIFLDEHLFPKITGFNICKEIPTNSTAKSNKIKGTPIYLAPEIYLNKEYSPKSDVYSFSLIMYEIITNEKPYSDLISPSEIRKNISEEKNRPIFNKPIPIIYKKLIERCWSQEPNDRPTFDEIVKELRTNIEFLTDSIDKNEYFNYIEFLDKYNAKFESDRKIFELENILSSNINTFNETEPFLDIIEMNETETNDLVFNYSFIDLDDFKKEYQPIKGFFYEFDQLHHKESNISYAKKSFVYDSFYLIKHGIKNFHREIGIISQLNHPSILKFIGYNPQDSPVIVTEYASNDTLKRLINIEKEKGIFSQFNDTKKIINIYGIAAGMSYLHSHNIIHRDLKPENIFLDEHLFPKITGFNICKEIPTNSTVKSNKIKGTPIYLAPEIYLNKEYSPKSDVYSFSLIIYEIITNEKPYSDLISPSEIRKNIAEEKNRPIFNKPIPIIYKKLIERCWSQEPNDRPTFDEIVKELRTNIQFLTDSIDKNEYFNYIKYIDESQITFDPSKKVIPIDNFVPSIIYNKISMSDIKINIRSVDKTEVENVLFDHDFINIQDFEKQELLHSEYSFKFYKIIHKESKLIYRAKRFNNEINNINDENLIELINELNTNIEINHPTFLKFIGYSPVDFKKRPKPTLITEYAPNDTLDKILDLDQSLLNNTKRLIILYGIASGMKFLHSLRIIHCELKLSNIFLDDYLYPKIAGLDKSKPEIQDSLYRNFEISNPSIYFEDEIHYSPEVQMYKKYSFASDVYAFAMIAYRLITNEEPFSDLNLYNILDDICYKNFRPEFKQSIPECYRNLIEKCWSQEPKNRPTFEEIVYHLGTNDKFITRDINEEEYRNYIKFIETTQNENLSSKSFLKFDDYIKSKNPLFRKINIDFKKLKESRNKFSINMGSTNLNLFDKQQKIGSGGFGVVYKSINKTTGAQCAMKISINEMDQCPDDIIKNISREIDIMSHLNHPSILKYIGYSPINFKNKPKPVIITELAVNGSLADVIELERNGIGLHDWDDTKKLINIYGIASAMKYLHNNNILHRDLKPANILLDEYLYPKIADFGLSKNNNKKSDIIENRKKNSHNSGFVGTIVYCSPEVLKKHEYSFKSDVYAFGLIVYEIMTSEIPFKVSNTFQLLCCINNKIRPKFTYPIPYCYKKLIEKCWSESVSDRPYFYKIVRELENDTSYITSNVDKDEYLNYIAYIKENEKNIVNNNNFNNQPKPHDFAKNANYSHVSNNFKVEELEKVEEIKCDIFLDLSNYEKLEIISKCDFFKIYKFKEKKTNNIYSGQMSMTKINTKLSDEDISNLSCELKIISKLNHPSLLKFIGYSPIDFKQKSKPVIITEYASNGSLNEVINIDRMNHSIPEWDDTKKLINIYGIASGMSYLHSHDILHRNLKLTTIYLDEILFPKIGDFGLSMKFFNHESLTFQSISGLQGSPIYLAPEVLQYSTYTKSSDVYSFAFVLYEILSYESPFKDINNFNQIYSEIVGKCNRPNLPEVIPIKFRELIEKCWDQDPNKRPTFEEITQKLKMDNGFITEKVNKENFYKYIEYIDTQINTCKLIHENKNSVDCNKKLENRNGSELLNENMLDNKKPVLSITYYINAAENGDVEAQKFLFKKYTKENDTENIYKYFCMLIKKGNSTIPIEYALNLFKLKYYKQAFNYFSLISKINHPIAKYYIGIMKFKGYGCNQNREEAYEILKDLAEKGIDRARDFIEDNFYDD